jgi:anti-anti-sigma factor
MLTTQLEGPVLRLIGEVDLGTVHVLEDAVAKMPRLTEVSLDLSEVTFMDSAGLRGLLGLCNLYGQIVVHNPSNAVERLIALTQTERRDGFTIRRGTDRHAE